MLLCAYCKLRRNVQVTSCNAVCTHICRASDTPQNERLLPWYTLITDYFIVNKTSIDIKQRIETKNATFTSHKSAYTTTARPRIYVMCSNLRLQLSNSIHIFNITKLKKGWLLNVKYMSNFIPASTNFVVLHKHTPYSKFCKYGLMMVNWPKHVVEVKKNRNIYCSVWLKPEMICFLLVYNTLGCLCKSIR